MQAYSGLSCSMHLDIGLGIANGDLHGYIGKGHYVGIGMACKLIMRLLRTKVGKGDYRYIHMCMRALQLRSYETCP